MKSLYLHKYEKKHTLLCLIIVGKVRVKLQILGEKILKLIIITEFMIDQKCTRTLIRDAHTFDYSKYLDLDN